MTLLSNRPPAVRRKVSGTLWQGTPAAAGIEPAPSRWLDGLRCQQSPLLTIYWSSAGTWTESRQHVEERLPRVTNGTEAQLEFQCRRGIRGLIFIPGCLARGPWGCKEVLEVSVFTMAVNKAVNLAYLCNEASYVGIYRRLGLIQNMTSFLRRCITEFLGVCVKAEKRHAGTSWLLRNSLKPQKWSSSHFF